MILWPPTSFAIMSHIIMLALLTRLKYGNAFRLLGMELSKQLKNLKINTPWYM